jgi:hypothetical protein
MSREKMSSRERNWVHGNVVYCYLKRETQHHVELRQCVTVQQLI